MPAPLFNLTAATAPDGRVFLVGGGDFTSPGRPTSLRFSVYDPATAAHRVLTSVPGATGAQPAAAFAGRKLIVVDGDAWRYDLDTNCWAPVPAPVRLVNRAAATGPDGRAYFFGGEHWPMLEDSSAVHAYDPATDKWETLPSMPFTGYAMGAATAGGRVYVTGLWTASFDPSSGTWKVLALPPTLRYWLSAAADAAGRIVALGGWQSGGEPGTWSGTEIYDPVTDRWTTATPPSLRVAQMGVAATCGGAIFTFGGDAPIGVVDVVQVYDAAADRWRISQ
jgi:hypothetical protein